VCAGSGGGVDQADARHGGLDRPRMEWAVALPGVRGKPGPMRNDLGASDGSAADAWGADRKSVV
jgi:hypothetical protein